jgi:thiol-disulfide isomerase/thioredoxin
MLARLAARLHAVRAWLLATVLVARLAGSAVASPGKPAPAPPVPVADLATIRAAIEAPGASAVLVNVWATWCEPCRQELPAIVRFYRAHRAAGLRLVLVSADDEDQGAAVAAVLTAAGAGDAGAFIKHGDDTAFVNAFDPAWSGALPVSFLYDGGGTKRHFWPAPVTTRELEAELGAITSKTTAKTASQKTSDKKGTP